MSCAGKPSFGTWLSLGDLFATRLLARMDFAWLTLDLEHGRSMPQAAMIFAAIADAGCIPLARVPKGNHDYISAFSMPAPGIVVPMVDTVEQGRSRSARPSIRRSAIAAWGAECTA